MIFFDPDKLISDWQACYRMAHSSYDIFGKVFEQVSNYQFDQFNQLLQIGNKSSIGLFDHFLHSYTDITKQEKRVVLMSGDFGPVGTAISKKLSAQGHHIFVCYNPSEKLTAKQWLTDLRREGYYFHHFECDTSHTEECIALINSVKKRVGPIDIVINCFGNQPTYRSQEQDKNHWHRSLVFNLNHLFNITRNVVGEMQKRHYGRIINISLNAESVSDRTASQTPTSLTSITGFSRALAHELENSGITINTLIQSQQLDDYPKLAAPQQLTSGLIEYCQELKTPNNLEYLVDSVVSLLGKENNSLTGKEISMRETTLIERRMVNN